MLRCGILRRWGLVVGILLGGLVGRPVVGDEVTFFDFGSEWKYLPGLTEASEPDPTAWREPDFDDSAWASGRAPFGYGRGGPWGTDLSELDPPMSGNYSSLFLRSRFDLANLERLIELHFEVTYDDGFILWVNGVEVARARILEKPGVFVPYDAIAASGTPGTVDVHLTSPDVPIAAEGNVMCIQVFNRGLRNNDLKLDARVFDPLHPDLEPPAIAHVIPLPGTTVRRLSQVEVSFDEPVEGVDASDLDINGRAARELTEVDASRYQFTFTEPPVGTVRFEWISNHSITDRAVDRNPFGGGNWSYDFDPSAPVPSISISEFVAASDGSLVDEEESEEDWIEISNDGSEAVALGGWTLTDDATEPDKWLFPDVVLAPQERLIVFASGKDRRDPEAELHTNFKLDAEGEYLGIYPAEIPRVAIEEFTPKYPHQRSGVAYGRQDGEIGYLDALTPGETNDAARRYSNFATPPSFSARRGYYEQPFLLELWARTPGASIYYTLDGATPSPDTALLYRGPIEVHGESELGMVMVRAAAFREDLLPSAVVTHSYLFPRDVLRQPDDPQGFPDRWGNQPADYELDAEIIDPNREMAIEGLRSIPSISIVTDMEHLFGFGTGIYTRPSLSGPLWERPTSAELLFADGRRGFQIDCGIRTQGGSSTNDWKSRKVSLRLLFKEKYGATKLRYPLYEGSTVTRFDTLVLDAGLNYTLNHPGHSERIRAQNVRDQFVADLQNEAGGFAPRGKFVHVFLNGAHWGVYYIHERPDASYAAEHFGGSKDDYDAMRHRPTTVVDGDNLAYLELTRLRDLDDPVQYAALEALLDIQNFADYILINNYVGNTDWAHQNWYATRRRDPPGPFRFHSWDAEIVLLSPTEFVLNKNDGGGPTGIFTFVKRNPEFRVLFGDRVHKHFFEGGMLFVNPDAPEWNPDEPTSNMPAMHYMRRIEEIYSAILLEYARWGDNWRMQYTRDDWLNELDWLLVNYFPVRSARVLDQFRGQNLYPSVEAPVLSRHGGAIEPGFELTIQLPAGSTGTMYYTTDGTDPREVGGEVSPAASAYTGALILSEETVVKARNLGLDANEEMGWSALSEARFTVPAASPRQLAITEIMFNPRGGGDYEFIEISNPAAAPVRLGGISFTDGIGFTFDEGASIAPGGSIVLTRNPQAFRDRYPGVKPLGAYTGKLANEGERVELSGADGESIFVVRFRDSGLWPIAADGFGFSLVLEDVAAPPEDPLSWRASALVDGSPGAADPAAEVGGILINEVATDGGGAEPGVELFNFGAAAVDLSGWWLSGNRGDLESLKAFRMPAGTRIEAGGYAVVRGGAESLPVSAGGGTLFLTAFDSTDEFTGFITSADYGIAELAGSFGLHLTSNTLDFTPLRTPTLGTANDIPMAAAVAINEVHYHPRGNGTEFIELYNPSGDAVDVGGWKLSGVSGSEAGEDYVIPSGSIIAPHGFLLAVPMAPELFRDFYLVPDAAPIVGPYAGALDNGGERLALWMPSARIAGSFVRVDMVRFDDRTPWPIAADGDGYSLERVLAAEYGNEVENWEASELEGGTPGFLNSVTPISGETPSGRQVPGDFNQDARLNISDAIALLRELFSGAMPFVPCGGSLEAEGARALLDQDGDQEVALSDALFLLSHLFEGGAPPALGRDCTPIVGCPEICP